MFKEFQESVFKRYQELKNNMQLPFAEKSPSTKDLKQWCIDVYDKGLEPADAKVFVKFFQEKPSEQLLEISMDKFQNDKFRPMQNFLEGKTKKNPDRNIVKLLAVLVDFQPRPYTVLGNEYNAYLSNDTAAAAHSADNTQETPKNEDERPALDPENASLNIPQATVRLAASPEKVKEEDLSSSAANADMTSSERENIKNKRKKFFFYTAGITTLIISIIAIVYSPKDCMCWNGERYIPVDCQDKTQRFMVIGLDEDKLQLFHKIKRTDTLGNKDIGRIWYSKINHEVEFFSGPGHHPVQQHKSLKAATAYMLKTYAGAEPTKEKVPLP